MKYDRIIIAYHGCDEDVAERLLDGAAFSESNNDYDWLGSGVYFWEYGVARALDFAREQSVRKKRASRPAAVGALIQLGNCFDLMDLRFTDEVRNAYAWFKKVWRGRPLPKNTRLLRRRDCAVLNLYFRALEEQQIATYDTVRCAFVEGDRAFPGSEIRRKNHIQIAVRNPACIIGVFRPKVDEQ